MKKSFFLSVFFVLLTLVSCSFGDEDNTSNSSNGNISIEETRVEFKNSTDCLVKIYSDSLRQTLLETVNSNDKKIIKIDYSKNGTPLYIDYYLIVNDYLIKYGDSTTIVQLKENNVVVVEIPAVTNKYNSYTVIGLKNLSSSGIELLNGNTICFKEDGTSIINKNEIDYFLFSKELQSSNLIINDAGINYNFNFDFQFEKSIIYSFEYNGNGKLYLTSKVPFDPSIISKIWKIPLSQENKKYISPSKLVSCANPSDGYLFAGQLSYDRTFLAEDSMPYIAEVSLTGNVSDSIINLRDNPKAIYTDSIIEKDGRRIFAGIKKNTDSLWVPFICGDKGCDFYLEPKIENFGEFIKIIYKEDNVFSILFTIGDENFSIIGFGIFELSINSYSSVDTNVVYMQDSGFIPQDFVYSNDTYLILAQSGSSELACDKSHLIFINGVSFELMAQKDLSNYLLNSIALASDGNIAFASGSYQNSITGKDAATFVGIDIKNCSIVKSDTPKLFPARDNSLTSNFSCISIKEKELILAGFIDKNLQNYPNTGYPYIISYNFEKDSVNWIQIYDNDKKKEFLGYEITSCSLSEIGTPLIILSRNFEYGDFRPLNSYLVSCGLLGDIPNSELAPLPRNNTIQKERPYFHINVVDYKGAMHKIEYPTSKAFSVSGIKEFLSADFYVPDGYFIVGFRDVNNVYYNESYSGSLENDTTIYVDCQKFDAISDLHFKSYTTGSTVSFELSWTEVTYANTYTVQYKIKKADNTTTAWLNAGTFTNNSVILQGNSSSLLAVNRVPSSAAQQGQNITSYSFKVNANRTAENIKSEDSNVLTLTVYPNYPCSCTIREDKSVNLIVERTGLNAFAFKWDDDKSYYVHFIDDTGINYYTEMATSGKTFILNKSVTSLTYFLSSSTYYNNRVSNYVDVVIK